MAFHTGRLGTTNPSRRSRGLPSLYNSTQACRFRYMQSVLVFSSRLLNHFPVSPTKSPHVKPCADWLLRNLHNPYADSTVCTEIAQQTSARKKDVENWFADARKRIGWNALRKSRFNNKKADIVAAAAKFFGDSAASIDLPFCLEHEFASIQIRAREIVSRLQDSSPAIADSRLAYPSPTPSPQRQTQLLTPASSLSSLLSESSNRKRRSSPFSTDDGHDSSYESETHCQKRPRYVSTCSSRTAQLIPLLYRRDVTVVEQVSTLSPPPSPRPSPKPFPSSTKRKRRLSDSGDAPSAKRFPPQILPRPQATSNPLPVPQSVDTSSNDWFYNLLGDITFSAEIPLPADIGAAPEPGELDIHFSTFAPPSLYDSLSLGPHGARSPEANSQPGSPPRSPFVGTVDPDQPYDQHDSSLSVQLPLPQDNMSLSDTALADWLSATFDPISTCDGGAPGLPAGSTLWTASFNTPQAVYHQPVQSLHASHAPLDTPTSTPSRSALYDSNAFNCFDYPTTSRSGPVAFAPPTFHHSTIAYPAAAAPPISKEALLQEMRALGQKMQDLEEQIRAAQ
jgi:C-terminal domain of homeodomain 1/Homeobox KN domain